jgi:fructoselysine-6-P-deglycase FrlB-like protein
MTEMIAAEPALAERVLGRLADVGSGAGELASAIAATARSGEPIVVTGCGTSEHGAFGTVEILRHAMRRAGLPTGPGSPIALQAFETSLDAPVRGLVIGISHEGGTSATNAALAAARASGGRTALVTVSDRSPGAALADIVVVTGEMDQSWCHTVGYVSPLLAATAVAGHLTGDRVDAVAVRGLLASGLADPGAAEAIAASFVHARTIVVIGSGADRTAARELVLKIEEGAWIPSAMRDLETFLHGHVPSTDDRTGLVLILADRERRADRLARARQALEAARVLGLRTAAIVARDVDPQLDHELTPAGRLIVDEAPALASPVAALLGTATALQLLTERLARACGTNPDPIRRDDERYRRAADVAD